MDQVFFYQKSNLFIIFMVLKKTRDKMNRDELCKVLAEYVLKGGTSSKLNK